MKQLKLYLVFVILCSLSFSISAHQKDKFVNYHEVGLFIGESFYSGDLNPYKFIDIDYPGLAAGLLYKIDFDRRNALRFSANYGHVSAYDSYYDKNPFQVTRALNFQSKIYEASIIYEFNFFPYEMGYKAFPVTPYIFGGIGGFYFNPTATYGTSANPITYKLHDLYTEGQGVKTNDTKPYSRVQVCIPFGVGVKANLGKRFGVQLEWGARKLFTDYLDDVSTSYTSNKFLFAEVSEDAALASGSIDYNKPKKIMGNVGQMRGNSKNKDWYSFIGLSFTYKISFGSTCPSFN